MKPDRKTSLVTVGLSALFTLLVVAFLSEAWGRPERLPEVTPVDPSVTNAATVRLSAGDLMRSGGDTSGMKCYACHEKGKPVQVHFDSEHRIKLPEEHNDLVIRHGRNNRNDHCFNCHDPENLDHLKTRDGLLLKIEESTQLCASCHGPTYRDWEAGVHGRTSGYWDRTMGKIERQECASCHDPHSPAFPSMKPGPGPNRPHTEGPGKNRQKMKGER